MNLDLVDTRKNTAFIPEKKSKAKKNVSFVSIQLFDSFIIGKLITHTSTIQNHT